MRILLALLLWLTPAVAQEKAPAAASTAVRLQGAVNMPATYSMAQLAGLPSVSVTLSIEGHGDVSGVWKGVPLLALIQKAGLSGQGSGLEHVIIARGTDNYSVAIAMGENLYCALREVRDRGLPKGRSTGQQPAPDRAGGQPRRT